MATDLYFLLQSLIRDSLRHFNTTSLQVADSIVLRLEVYLEHLDNYVREIQDEIPLYTHCCELQISVGQLLVLWQTKLLMLDGPQPIRQRGRPRIPINVEMVSNYRSIDSLLNLTICSSKC